MFRIGIATFAVLMMAGCGGTAARTQSEDPSIAERRARVQAGANQDLIDAAQLTAEELAAMEAAQAAEAQRRAEASSVVPGLTVGQVEDQPQIRPPLPQTLDYLATDDDVVIQALLTARAEQAAGMLVGSCDLFVRQQYLLWLWEPELDVRKERARIAQQAHADRHKRLKEQVVRHNKWKAEQKRLDEINRQAIRKEANMDLPVLTVEQRRDLDAIAASND